MGRGTYEHDANRAHNRTLCSDCPRLHPLGCRSSQEPQPSPGGGLDSDYDRRLGSPRLFVSLLSLAEWGLAVWLLSGITRRHAWVASGCAVFGIVIAAVILKTLAPDQSCGCFGGSTLDLPGITWFRIGGLLLVTGIGLMAHLSYSTPSSVAIQLDNKRVHS